jgi:hypothetical protein
MIIISTIMDYLCQRDQIAPNEKNLIHFRKGTLQKTTLGGIISLIIEIYILGVIFVSTKKLLLLEDPYISALGS